jgi:hypothetical protein
MLCDVACDYAGKCILIAAALTIIERSLLPDRPAFWVTAGRRGGGKTTTIIMLLTAVTGIRPAAAAWSPNEEERRKALLAYLLEALPAIVIILLGNPLFHSGSVPPQTRFKTWWSLIGRPVEYAAQQHKEYVAAFVMDAHPTCLPASINFKDLFLVQEEDDEESASLADALAALADEWPDATPFEAAEVAKLANNTGEWSAKREQAMTLREFLFPTIPENQAVTAKSAGKRLKRRVSRTHRHSRGGVKLYER